MHASLAFPVMANVLVAKLGYPRAIMAALFTMVVGCLVMPLATSVGQYEIVLVGLFIIGSGITVLQVAANPLVAALGTPEEALASAGLAIPTSHPSDLALRLRSGDPPILARIQDDRVLIDGRTVMPGEEEMLLQGIIRAIR